MGSSVRGGGSSRWGSVITAVTGVALLLVLAKVLGFTEKLVLAHLLGTSAESDAYFAALQISFLLFVVVDDIVVPAFLTQYVHLRTGAGEATARRFFRAVLQTTLLGLLVAAGLLFLGQGRVVPFLAPGFDSRQTASTLQLLPWTLGAGVLLGLSSMTYAALNAHHRFVGPTATQVAYKLIVVVGLVSLVPSLGLVAAGVTLCIAAGVQLLLQSVLLRRTTRGPSPPSDRAEGAVPGRGFGRLILPLAVGTVLAQVNGFVDLSRGSTLAEGTLAAIGYARRLIDMPVLLFPGVLGIVAFPYLAEFAARRDEKQLTIILGRLLQACLVVFLPLSALFVLEASPIIAIVFGRGAFQESSVEATAQLLRWFAVGLPFFAVEILVLRAYFALRDTITPVSVGLVFVAINILLTVQLVPRIGAIAIPFALALQKAGKVLVLLALLRHRLASWRWREGLLNLLRLCLASLVFVALLLLTKEAARALLGDTFRSLATLCAQGIVASAGYLWLLARMGVLRGGEIVAEVRALLRARNSARHEERSP